MNSEHQILTTAAQRLGIHIEEQQATQLSRYLDQLYEANLSFNLTRISRVDAPYLHIVDSLTTLCAPLPNSPSSILDIGTGGGFPGVPLAALLPNARVTLLDSTRKKVLFSHNAASQCGISNTLPIHERAEVYARAPGIAGSFDLVVSRAVADCKVLFKWMLPFVAPGGTAVALKSAGVIDELKGTEPILKRHGATIRDVQQVSIPDTNVERFLVILGKP